MVHTEHKHADCTTVRFTCKGSVVFGEEKAFFCVQLNIAPKSGFKKEQATFDDAHCYYFQLIFI